MTPQPSENIKIYVISLPSDEGRRKNIRAQFKSTFTSFDFFSAIDLRTTPMDECLKIPKKRALKMTAAEIGCSLSHINAIKDFLTTTKNYCLILEDDVIGNDYDIQKAIEFTATLPDTGLAFLGGLQGLKNKNFIYGKEKKSFKKNNVYKIHNSCKIFLARTCCYLITRAVGQKIIQKQELKLMRADQWDILLKDVEEIYYMDLFSHPTNLSHSHIEKDRKKMQKTFFNRLFSDGLYRAIKRTLLKPYIGFFLGIFGYKEIPSK